MLPIINLTLISSHKTIYYYLIYLQTYYKIENNFEITTISTGSFHVKIHFDMRL